MDKNQVPLSFFLNASHYYHIYKINYNNVGVKFHHHDYYQVCYVCGGKLLLENNSESIVLMPGEGYIMPPIQIHRMSLLEDETSYYSLSFKEPLFLPHFQYSTAYKFMTSLSLDMTEDKAPSMHMHIKFCDMDRKPFELLMECLIGELSRKYPRESTNADSLIAALLVIMARNYFSATAMEEKLRNVNEYSSIMTKCLDYINVNYMLPLTISDLSKRFAISRSIFSSMFPKVAGMPFKQYLNKRRIDSAAAFCAIDTLTFYEIAEMCGYNDSSTFYRNFTKFHGISPTEFRNLLSKNK